MDKIKIVVGGGYMVGKLVIITQYVENIFDQECYIKSYSNTFKKRILINNEEMILEINNLLSQERDWSINKQ